MRLKFLVVMVAASLVGGGCQKNKPDSGPGEGTSSVPQTEADLIANKGQPQQRKPSILKTQSEILTYSNHDSYQVSNHAVEAKFRDPQGDERNLQYWRHRWEGHEQEDRSVAGDSSHGVEDMRMLYSRREKVSILYYQESGVVSRVIEYGEYGQ